jgi:uncharacterized protein (DUF1778 family)
MKAAAATPAKRAPRETLNLRIPAAERSLIDRAAHRFHPRSRAPRR